MDKEYIERGAICDFFKKRYEYLREASEAKVPGGYIINDTVQGGAIIAKEFLDKAKEAPAVKVVEVERAISAIINTPAEFNATQATPDFLNGLAHRQNEIIDILKTLAEVMQNEMCGG